MKKLFIVILLSFTNLYLFGQNKNINLQLSKIKWTGKEITTKTHYGSLKFTSGNILFENDEIVEANAMLQKKRLNPDYLNQSVNMPVRRSIDDRFSNL